MLPKKAIWYVNDNLFKVYFEIVILIFFFFNFHFDMSLGAFLFRTFSHAYTNIVLCLIMNFLFSLIAWWFINMFRVFKLIFDACLGC